MPKKSNKHDKTYRSYSQASLDRAYNLVHEDGYSVYKSSRMCGVPEQTLRDRVKGKVSVQTIAGKEPIFTSDEEQELVNHILHMNRLGYGYSRAQMLRTATEMADFLHKKRPNSKNSYLGRGFMRGFMKRWPELRMAKPRSLDVARARSTNPHSIGEYFKELEQTLTTNNLLERPGNIWNLDESGFSPEHNPPRVLCDRKTQPQAIVSPRGPNTTVIGCGNALGQSVPPYFVFKGAKWDDGLLEGCVPGSSGTVTKNGWSNSEVFQQYLKEHFLQYATQNNHPLLLLYDGHTTHVNSVLVEWARKHNIILFVLPPHTSHILQPLDVGIFGPLKTMYYSQCQNYMRQHPGEIIGRWNICRIICAVYYKAFSSNNLISAFRKTGIMPLNKSAISDFQLAPHKGVTPKNVMNENLTPTTVVMENQRERSSEKVAKLLNTKIPVPLETPNVSKRRKASVRGNLMDKFTTTDITDKQTSPDIQEASTSKENSKIRPKQNSGSSQKIKKRKNTGKENLTSPKKQILNKDESSPEESEDEDEKCTVCGLWTPIQVRNSTSIVFVKWAKCDNCGQWCHLRFCTQVTVVRCSGEFICPKCDPKSAVVIE